MITIVWQTNFEGSWEKDWIEHLFRFTPHRTITDYDQKLALDRSLIVYNSTVNNDEYIKRLHSNGTKFGLIHLSDEWGKDSTENYKFAHIVLRNYYKNLGPNVINFPLGCMKTFPYNLRIKTVQERKYAWGFSGHVDKTTRPQMAAAMSTVPNGQYFFKHCGQNWGPFDGHALNPIEMASMYNDSIFIPCPQGNCSIDSLRVCEALQAGALPIVEKNEYWMDLYGDDHPLIQINSWADAPKLIESMCSDVNMLELVRSTTHKWWINYCDALSKKLIDII